MKSICIASLCIFSVGMAFGQVEPPKDADDFLGTSFLVSPSPRKFNVTNFGEIQFHAVVTGIGMSQTNAVVGDYNSLVDISNAQIVLKKDSGLFQFYVQSGYYSTPSLGSTYQRAAVQTKDSFGIVPLASISVAPSKNWIFTGGKINSFGGYENTFTYQNANIDRGLLWNQTSNVSKGFQATYKENSVTAALTLNDGFYSNQLSWMGASINYQINSQSSTSLVWAGAIKTNSTNTFITPVLQNNSQIFNAIYAYSSGNWTVAPYLQYTYVPSNPSIGILTSAQTSGAAILTNYRIPSDIEGRITLPLRLEYISSGGLGNQNSPNLLYGPGSAAWSITVTPTYQYENVFLRGELSYVQAMNSTPGQAFGATGNAKNQSRAMVEVGVFY